MRVIIAVTDPQKNMRLVARCKARANTQVVARCASPNEAQRAMSWHRCDAIVLSARLDKEAAFALARRASEDGVCVVICSNEREDAVTAFDLGAVDFLCEDADEARIDQSLDRLAERVEAAAAERGASACRDDADARREDNTVMREDFWIKDRGRVMRIGQDEIEWVEAERDYVRLHVQGRSWLVRDTMQRMERRLDSKRFMRVHRSAIVNANAVRMASTTPSGGRMLRLRSGAEVRVGRSYEPKLARIVNNSAHT